MSDRFQELSVFVRAADSGSFSAAARDLALSQPSVSRIVSELEARLGVRLLLRSTRRVALTEAGAAFLARARQVLHDLDEADQAARAHPALKFEFLASDGMHDLLAGSADIALRFGPLADSPFGARKLAMLPRVVLAAPSYLRARGAPETPRQLADHDCIVGPNAASFQQWRLTDKAPATTPRMSSTSCRATCFHRPTARWRVRARDWALPARRRHCAALISKGARWCRC